MSSISRPVSAFMLLACLLAAGQAQADPGYKSVTLSANSDASEPASVFRPDTAKIFLRAEISEVPPGSKLACAWVAAEVADVPAGEQIARVDLVAEKGLTTLNCNLTKPTAGFPVGAYRVDLLVDDKKTNEARFSVRPAANTVPAAAAAPARQNFALVNRTGYDISEVYVSPAKKKDWEEDILGDDELEDGDEQLVRFNRAEKTCMWDLKVVYSDDDSEAIWYDIDLCRVSKITIRYNRKSDTTTAVFD